MEKNLKNMRKEFQKRGIFYTPKEDALKFKKLIDIEYDEVYDPTCGQGNLLQIFDDNIKKYGQELDPLELEKAKSLLANFEGYAGDTLKEDKFKDKKFKLIIANPPFSIKWEPNKDDERFSQCPVLAPKSKADWGFNIHIIAKLKNDGEAIVLNFPGTAYRGNAEKKIRKWFIDNNYIDKVISYPPKTFVDTAIATVIYIFKKNRPTTDITFVNDNADEKTVTKDEVIDNDYNLSPSYYVPIEEEKEEIDPKELSKQAREGMIKHLKKDIKMDLTISLIEKDLEGHRQYLNNLKNVINQAKTATDDILNVIDYLK